MFKFGSLTPEKVLAYNAEQISVLSEIYGVTADQIIEDARFEMRRPELESQRAALAGLATAPSGQTSAVANALKGILPLTDWSEIGLTAIFSVGTDGTVIVEKFTTTIRRDMHPPKVDPVATEFHLTAQDVKARAAARGYHLSWTGTPMEMARALLGSAGHKLQRSSTAGDIYSKFTEVFPPAE
jgi:hypothetical protein